MTKITKLPIAALLLSPVLALAAVPPTVTFSARIADDGRPVTGPHAFTFTLWNVETGGVAGTNDVWTEGPRIIQVNDGVVATALGDVANGGTALPAFDGTPLWLEVTIGTTTFPRRIAIHSAPYAMRAAVAESVSSPLLFTTTIASASIAAAACDHFVDGTSCPTGYTAISVGCTTAVANTYITNEWINPFTNAGRCGWCNNTAGTVTGTVYTNCARLP